MPDYDSILSRRQFIEVIGKSALAVTLTSPLLTGCLGETDELVRLINEYRAEPPYRLPPIPKSPKLTVVAGMHISDLRHYPRATGCNAHSWSDGSSIWEGCCYMDDPHTTLAQMQCMWKKPREITGYAGNGYEIMATSAPTAFAALDGWKNSVEHNAVILNQLAPSGNDWTRRTWRALGTSIAGGIACAWFGEIEDLGIDR